MLNNVLVIGSGAREHAISWKLSASPLVNNVFISPGNACKYSVSGIILKLKKIYFYYKLYV